MSSMVMSSGIWDLEGLRRCSNLSISRLRIDVLDINVLTTCSVYSPNDEYESSLLLRNRAVHLLQQQYRAFLIPNYSFDKHIKYFMSHDPITPL